MSMSVNQALGLFLGELQRRLQAQPPAYRNAKTDIVYDPQGRSVALSVTELMSEVQRGTSIGVNEAIKYAQSQGYSVY